MSDHGIPGRLPRADPPGTEPALHPDLLTDTPLAPLDENGRPRPMHPRPMHLRHEPEHHGGDEAAEPDDEPTSPDSRTVTSRRYDVPEPEPGPLRKIKRKLTKRSRTDLSRHMTAMCHESGWQSTTLNPNMPGTGKLTILSVRFGNVAAGSDPEALYVDLLDLSAAAMGWAQALQREVWRRQKREQRARKRAAKRDKRKRKK